MSNTAPRTGVDFPGVRAQVNWNGWPKHHCKFVKRITRADVQANRDYLYLFGDNLVQRGQGGQAAECRGEPNALGIPTKKAPGREPGDYFTDDEYTTNCAFIQAALEKIPPGAQLAVSAYGIGTGLAELDRRAPLTFAFLQARLVELGAA